MSPAKLQRGLDNFGRALNRLEEALAMPGDDAATRDVAWKALRPVADGRFL